MPSFDGDNLIITLDSGMVALDAEVDLYKAWKLWQLAGNMRYPQAFRTIGGDALTGSVDAGAYFFIQNQNGWRIRPPEEDITILLTGNLAPEDSTLPILIPTLGNFTVLVQGIQPITQNIDGLAAEISYASFGGGISIDPANGVDGTAAESGNKANPVKTLPTAITLAQSKGFNALFVAGALTVQATENVDGYHFFGEGEVFTALTVLAGASTVNTAFHQCALGGALSGNTEIEDVHIAPAGVSGFYGEMHRTMLYGDLGLVPNQTILIGDCASATASTTHPKLTVEGSGEAGAININNYTGDVGIHGLTLNELAISIMPGHIIIDADCTGGTIEVKGIGQVTDNSVGAVVDTDYVVSGAELKLLRQIAQNKRIVKASNSKEVIRNDADTADLYQADLWKDEAQTTPYDGTGAAVRGKLTLVP